MFVCLLLNYSETVGIFLVDACTDASTGTQARAVDTADRPASTLIAWALVEERQENLLKSRELYEKVEILQSQLTSDFLRKELGH